MGLNLTDWQAQPRSERALQWAAFELDHTPKKQLDKEQAAVLWEIQREKVRKRQ